jgi:hypothetical protein
MYFTTSLTIYRIRRRALPLPAPVGYKIFFGTSLTITSHNVEAITSDDFMDFLIAQGVRFLWSFHYIPIGRQPDVEVCEGAGLHITPGVNMKVGSSPGRRPASSLQSAGLWRF